jgi:hypothetical protein
VAHFRADTPSLPGVEPAERSTLAPRPAANLIDQAAHALTKVDDVLIRLWTDAVADTGHHPNAWERIVNAAPLVRLARVTLTATVIS